EILLKMIGWTLIPFSRRKQMNKQEAIEIIEQNKIELSRLVETNSGANSTQQKIKLVDHVPLEIVVNTIDKIGLKKAVVPRFVAEWIESEKSRKRRLSQALSSVFDELELNLYIKQQLGDYTEIIARAWLDGYEVEQEQLYTVEIPNPNATHDDVYILGRTLSGSIAIWRSIGRNGNKNYDSDFQLTESEIKQDFEWAWQWAKPVEVE
ncbi:DUF1642 domain-containing protein, partial [Streptococcus suis]|uniref:DUF1642 domain-containing protein n=2 Tax=Streptococcus suis TaxID=1307 RepID=UPI001C2EF5EC